MFIWYFEPFLGKWHAIPLAYECAASILVGDNQLGS